MRVIIIMEGKHLVLSQYIWTTIRLNLRSIRYPCDQSAPEVPQWIEPFHSDWKPVNVIHQIEWTVGPCSALALHSLYCGTSILRKFFEEASLSFAIFNMSIPHIA